MLIYTEESSPVWYVLAPMRFCSLLHNQVSSTSTIYLFSFLLLLSDLNSCDSVDIMTHVAWRQSGLPPTRVVGAGCNLDSERLSYILDINLNIHKPAWIIGELSDNKGEQRGTDESAECLHKGLCKRCCHKGLVFHLA